MRVSETYFFFYGLMAHILPGMQLHEDGPRKLKCTSSILMHQLIPYFIPYSTCMNPDMLLKITAISKLLATEHAVILLVWSGSDTWRLLDRENRGNRCWL